MTRLAQDSTSLLLGEHSLQQDHSLQRRAILTVAKDPHNSFPLPPTNLQSQMVSLAKEPLDHPIHFPFRPESLHRFVGDLQSPIPTSCKERANPPYELPLEFSLGMR